MKFTDRYVASLKPKASRYEKWEGGGFGIRVTPRGVKTWVWMFRAAGTSKLRRMTLGTYPKMGLADARVALSNAQKALAMGGDPGEAQVAKNRTEREAETVQELSELYLEKWARRNKKSAAGDERLLNKDVLPFWGRRKARDIKPRDVIELVDRIAERGAPIMANRALALLKTMFRWAQKREILSANPCALVARPAKEHPRNRVLRENEIRLLWTGLDNAPMSNTTRLALKFQLVTAQRKGEVAGAEWSEIDGDVWTIPPEKTKNALPHRVPLSSLALKLLELIRENATVRVTDRTTGKTTEMLSRWLLPSPRGGTHVTERSISHALKRSLPALGLTDVTPHDLRRTAASHMTSVGIVRLTVAKILNHAESSVTAVYDRHSYDTEKRQALETWGERLREIVSGEKAGENVVRIEERRQR